MTSIDNAWFQYQCRPKIIWRKFSTVAPDQHSLLSNPRKRLRNLNFNAIKHATQCRDVAAHCLEDTVLSLTSDAERSARKLAKGQSSATSDAILAAVLKSLDDDKAEDVVQIDLRGISEIGDHMVICSGRSTRQVAAISEKLKTRLKDDLGIMSKLEGKGTGDWVLVDTGDVIVHVFRPEVREFYQLDQMWLEPGAPAPSEA